MDQASAIADLGALKELFVELNDLKRIRSAGRQHSIAGRLFRGAWRDLVAGEAADAVMRRVAAAALAAARLGDLDAAALRSAGLEEATVLEVLRRSFDEVTEPVEPGLRADLRGALSARLRSDRGELPPFVEALGRQPRAGITSPGRPRIVLEPPEDHAEHCLMVAVYGVLLSPRYGAEPATVFLAALSHHLHNALMPDSGFTGEMLLGLHLGTVIEATGASVLATLDPSLRARVEAARAILPDADTAEGRAFHAADVIDRVLQIAQHLRAAELNLRQVLEETELVHDGPVKAFHETVLRDLGLP